MMNDTVNIFKKIILSYMSFWFGIFFYFFFLEDSLSGSNDIVNNEISEPWLLLDTISILIFLINFYTLFLLYKLKPLGKKIFLPFLILSTVYGFFTDDLNDFYFDSKSLYLFVYLLSVLDGVIITFLYFTDVKKEFEK